MNEPFFPRAAPRFRRLLRRAMMPEYQILLMAWGVLIIGGFVLWLLRR